MSAQHTPGPWQSDGSGIYSVPAESIHPLPDGVTWRVVEHGAIRSRKSDEELAANVLLIAAAPQLLKYAKAFEQLITRDSDDLGFHLKLANAAIEDVEGLRAAIAAAEGQL